MKVTPTEGYTNYEISDSPGGVGYFVPEQAEPRDTGSFGASQAIASGLMKYNPVSAATEKLVSISRSNEAYDPDYSPHEPEELERLAGYPPHLFAHSNSVEQTDRIMREYDESRYRDDILAAQPVAGTMGSIAGGATNPIYLVPFLGATSRGVGAVAGGLRSAGGAIVGEAITEGITHAGGLDRTRTYEESMYNIAASAIFSGVLGAAIGAVPTGEAGAITRQVRQSIQPGPDAVTPPPVTPTGEPSLSGIRTLEAIERGEYEPGRIRGAVSRTTAELTPIRLLSSENPMTRAMAAELGEQNLVGTTRHSIESAIRGSERHVVSAMQKSRGEWDNLKRAGNSDIKNYSQFREEVSRAMRRGDESPIPEVANAARAWRSEVIDPITRRAQRAGILPDTIETVGARSYLPRVYNHAKINAHRGEFAQHLQRQIMKEPGVTAEEAMEAAKRVISKIAGEGPTDVMSIQQVQLTGGARARTIKISDEILEDYLVNDIDSITRHWTRQMSAQSEIAERYGNIDMKEALQKVSDQWDDIITQSVDPKKTAKLTRQKTKDIKTLEAVRDRLLGRYAMPEDYGSSFVRAGRAARNLNVTRLLGGMTISSIPDLARPIYQHGFREWAGGMAKLAKSPNLRKMVKADQRRLGVAIDTLLDNRIRNSSEMDFVPYHHSRAEQALETLAQGGTIGGRDFKGMNHLTLQAHWNENIKALSGMLSQDGLLHKAKDFNKFKKDLAKAGIDEDMARRIRAQYDTHGNKVDGLRFANSDQWTDADAAFAFENSIVGEVMNTVITPGALDRPLWMSTEIGKTIGQFKSFGFASTNKNLLANMQDPNIRTLQGLGAQISLGVVAWALRQQIMGDPSRVEEATGAEILEMGIKYSGVTGMGWDAAEMMMNSAAAAGMTDGTNPRFAQDRVLSGLMGPSADIPKAAFSAARLFTGEGSDYDQEAVIRMIPYQNLFYLRGAMGILGDE